MTSVLELDLHGTGDEAIDAQASDGLGVRRGDFVFIHPPGSTNGFTPPRVARIGELEPWVHELPDMYGTVGGWRKEMAAVGHATAQSQGTNTPHDDEQAAFPPPGIADLRWLGEVTGVSLTTLLFNFPDIVALHSLGSTGLSK